MRVHTRAVSQAAGFVERGVLQQGRREHCFFLLLLPLSTGHGPFSPCPHAPPSPLPTPPFAFYLSTSFRFPSFSTRARSPSSSSPFLWTTRPSSSSSSSHGQPPLFALSPPLLTSSPFRALYYGCYVRTNDKVQVLRSSCVVFFGTGDSHAIACVGVTVSSEEVLFLCVVRHECLEFN